MRRIIYSGFIKFLAVLLFAGSMVCGVLTATQGIIAFYEEENVVYSFERDFSQSGIISSLLNEPEWAVVSAYHPFTANGQIYENGIDMEENGEAIAEAIRQRFTDFFYDDKINYFVQWNDVIVTNCGAVNAESLMQDELFSYIRRDSDGNIDRCSTQDYDVYFLEDITRIDRTSNIVVCSSLKPEVAAEYRALWEKQQGIFINACLQTLVCAIAALLLLIYLVCVCGNKYSGECTSIWLDNIWIEIHLAAMAGIGIGAAALCYYVFDEYMSGYFPLNLIHTVIATVTALGSLGILTSLLSIVRNFKTHRLIDASIILRILRWLCRKAITLWKTLLKMLSRKTGIILCSMLLVYTAIIGLFGIGTVESPIWILFGVVLFGIACFVIAFRSKDLDEIKKGVSQVRSGNVSYKIPELRSSDMKILAEDINDIAKGIDESVSAKVKAERMKTELITNVSHDLKTPITSIISYTELLSKVEEMPDEAQDYVAVIAKKSDRLKKLTQDLFDISKVQSGNEVVVLEKLDVALLISQSLAEHDNEIQKSELPFCVEVPKELYISADGRKMSRVVSNLLHNILKYALKNTRVFITAVEKDNEVVLEFKNISAYPLDFNPEEITQRFVRGDEARSAEGNGLGLAIAKSYTELCNGTLEIVTDGDLFKAVLKFKKYG